MTGDGVANVNVTFSTDVDSVMAGHDNLHDVNVGQTPSNSTANPNKDSMLENESWFIRNNPLILKKWNPNVNLLKEDVVNVPVWVKQHGVHVMAFSKDSLSVIAIKLAMIKLRADVELKDTIVLAMPKLVWKGFYTCTVRVELGCGEKSKNLSQAPRGVLVGPKVGFKPVKQVYIPISKKNNVNTSAYKKKDVESTKEVSNPNLFDVLNSVENDVDLVTNGGTSNLASKEANSSGSSFWNVGSSSISTTPIVDKNDKLEKLIIDEKITLVDDEGKPLKKERVDYGNNSLLEQWREIYENADYDYDPYDDDMYAGQEIYDNMQSICYNLDIKLGGSKKKYIT
ncbi:reverse transcriptase domain-containing protein [Tanacetum coccineum]